MGRITGALEPLSNRAIAGALLCFEKVRRGADFDMTKDTGPR